MTAETDNLESQLAEARAALRRQDYQGAVDICRIARERAPGDSRFQLIMGAALRRVGGFEEAEPLLRSIIDIEPDFPFALLEYGLVCRSLGRLAEARRALEHAGDLEPGTREIWFALRDVRAAEGDDRGAAEAYRRSLAAKSVQPALQKAAELVSAGRLGIAEGICREALRQQPYDVDAIRLLAEIGIELGILDEAVLLLQRCLELAPDFMLRGAITPRL